MSSVGSLVGSVVGSLVGSKPGTLALPAGLAWSPSWGIGGGPGRGYRPGFDPRTRMITPTNTYYVSTDGNNLNTGLSEGQAFRDVWKAMNTAGVTPATIYVRGGRYDYENAVSGVSVGFPCNLIGYGGRVVLTTQPNSVSWASAGSGAYSTTYATTPYGVCDEKNRDAYGVATWLTPQASVAAVQASGGWFWSAGTLTIKTFDGRAPDAAVIAPLSSGTRWMMRVALGVNVYVQGIDFLGGYRAEISNVGSLTCVDTTFGYGEYVGCDIATATDVVHWRTRAIGTYGTGGAGGDGLGYQAAGSGNALEVDCFCASNGWDGVGISNGSSAHGNKVIRCGGIYANNQGPNIADVLGSKSVTLGALIGASRGSAGTSRSNVAVDGAGAAMWLADCRLDGKGSQDLWTGTVGGEQINLRNTGYTGSTGVGTIGTW